MCWLIPSIVHGKKKIRKLVRSDRSCRYDHSVLSRSAGEQRNRSLHEVPRYHRPIVFALDASGVDSARCEPVQRLMVEILMRRTIALNSNSTPLRARHALVPEDGRGKSPLALLPAADAAAQSSTQDNDPLLGTPSLNKRERL